MNKVILLITFFLSVTAASAKGRWNDGFIPKAPKYSDQALWYKHMGDSTGTGADVFYIVSTWEVDWQTGDGQDCHFADVYNQTHRDHMTIEISKVAEYMGDGNNFYSPFYRHTTIDGWISRNDSLLNGRLSLSMKDVKDAFDYFIKHRDNSRPLIIAGFSQGGRAVVELMKYMKEKTYDNLVAAYVLGYKVTAQDTTECKRFHGAQGATDLGVTICYNTVKDPKYAVDVISGDGVFCINPVNWKTDSTPATLQDTITITVDQKAHVLIAKGYAATEYKAFRNFINVGDIHSCEPWLYKECLRKNIKDRVKVWMSERKK